ncbi:pyridoxal-phosphate-dependent aminotransferase family protein [Thermodesulfatator atlanticus]|uniref:pyridoxal-phosphate-dependent aminotransferase family protein n=1 Tax=Thermodesulfatator atlanticus TaxID=501497 RepID=UPI0003B62005|nr:alanine--glyoxylate aminotransferase family protein [Thermodesulfatator atlanticus]
MNLLDKKTLLAPGPVPVPPKALLAMAKPVIHHRLPEFSAILSKIREDLKYLFQTKEDVLFFASSGTGAMESCVANLFSPGEKVIVVRGGKFGERWGKLAETYRLDPVYIDVEWGEAVPLEAVERALSENPDAKGLLIQAHETSTGVKHPVAEIASLTREKDILLVVDAISALGVYPLPFDELGIDAMVAGSQKSLALPPGLSFVALSQKAWDRVEKTTSPRYYFDFRKEKKALAKKTTAFTPAVSLLYGLSEILARIKEVGLERLFAHYQRLAGACRAGIAAMGLDLFAKAPCEALTIVKVPEGVDGAKLMKLMREKYQVTMAGGQAKLKGKVVRIAHLGYQGPLDVITALATLEMALTELGYKVPLGAGVAAAQKYFLANKEV